MHFFDGFRTSHEINKIERLSDETLKKMLPMDEIRAHRQRAMSPLHPGQRGTAQGPDVYMQMMETSNSYYNKFHDVLDTCFDEFEALTGRKYSAFEYAGHPDAEFVLVTMGSSFVVVRETVNHILATTTKKVGVVGVRTFRPWDREKLSAAIPATTKRIAVMDRTKEAGSQGEPLFLEVATSLSLMRRDKILIIGGRYGLSSKDFNPRMVQAVYANLWKSKTSLIKRQFTVGINDDVTNLSLNIGRALNLLPDKVTQCVFWGFGSDGTVGGNKNAIKIIGNFDETFNVQGYFEYDAKKSGGLTVSYLRFAEGQPINAPYKIDLGEAGYVACHNESYVQAHKYDVIKYLQNGGTFLLNTTAASLDDENDRMAALKTLVSPQILRTLARKKAKFYIIDAVKIANEFGLSGKINMICMTAFFRLSGVLPFQEAVALLKKAIHKTYSYKGDAVVQKNYDIVDTVCENPNILREVTIPDSWLSLRPKTVTMISRNVVDIEDKYKGFVSDIMESMSRFEGDDIPVSAFLNNGMLGGMMPPGTARYEKRIPNPSGKIPHWVKENCTQCNKCVFVCPHAVIRPFILENDEVKEAPYPENYETLRAQGAELAGKRYTLRISTLDCTGCNACVRACPEGPKALEMRDAPEDEKPDVENWKYSLKLPERGHLVDKTTVKGSQFQTPLMEFSGACSGCGETPYFKLITQLFGERLVIANATGCTTIWGGSFPSNPYTVNQKGRGPVWGNSLYEDNAEYGLGMWTGMRHRREKLVNLIQTVLALDGFDATYPELAGVLAKWLEFRDEKSDRCTNLHDEAVPLLLRALKDDNKYTETLQYIFDEKDLFPKLSQWVVGGDGWAYDIGFGGL
ncbi:MAG: pyruvate:ferredoxin (flavodoxin) oxidoreductase, partial [Candidatus Nanopelagicales bacterium]